MTHSKSVERPEKPYEDFPLFPHRCGQWCKKINKVPTYFGSWAEDPKGVKALAKYHDEIAGRPAVAEGLTIADLCNRYLNAKRAQVTAGDLVERTFKVYKGVTDVLVEFFKKHRVVETLTTADFERLREHITLATTGPKDAKKTKARAATSIGNFVQITRIVFRYAYDSEMIERPIRFGPTFKRPSRKVVRAARAAKGLMMFEASDVRAMLDKSDLQMKAMILLAANCGFGNADVGLLPIQAVDLEKGWVKFPRPKTAIDRRCPLWPETVAAIKAVLAKRRTPKDARFAGVLFVTKYGQPWFKNTSDNPVAKEFRKLLNELQLHRTGLGFYSLRRGFETVAAATRDQVAVDYIMGHAEDAQDMAVVYRQRIEDEQLQAVVDHVYGWLFPKEPPANKRKKQAVAK